MVSNFYKNNLGRKHSPGGGEGVLWLIAECVPLASQSPYPIILYFMTKYRPHVSHGFSASMLLFAIPTQQLSIFVNWPTVFFKFNEKRLTFHLQYKHSGMFAKRKYEELPYPKKSENVRRPYSQSFSKCDPIQRHIDISLL